jgi:hypothetical protein
MKAFRFTLWLARGGLIVASALLMLAAAVGWGRSYYIADDFIRMTLVDIDAQMPFGGIDGFEDGKGDFIVFRMRFNRPARMGGSGRVTAVHWSHQTRPPTRFQPTAKDRVIGIGHYGYIRSTAATGTGQPPAQGVCLPFALPLILGGIGPAWWALVTRRRARAARRMGQRLCHACGYDLRAAAARGPECGRSAPAGLAHADAGLPSPSR